MTPFIMDDRIKAALDKLRQLAEQDDRVISLEEMQRHAKGFDADVAPPTRCSVYPLDQTLDLPLGFKVTMSLEYQPFGMARHMSMSAPVGGRMPHPNAVQWVLLALGFVRPLEGCFLYEETYAIGRTAINVMEPLDPTIDLSKGK